MVDLISGGRLILALGIGYQKADFDAFGVPISNRVSLFEEGIEVIKRAWTEEHFSFHGKRYSLENVSLRPKPLQQPHPPIWLGGWTVEGVKRAGRVADAWLADPIQGQSAVKAMAGIYRETAAKRGRPSSVILMREGWVAENRAQAIAEYGEAVMIQHRYYWRNKAYLKEHDPWLEEIERDADLTVERIADRLILGSPEECIDQITRWQEEIGIDGLILRIRHSTGPSHEQVMKAIRRFGEKVIPHFG
jgi:alkanesulfonate monooxygenase SsuD/methylene tetrahydromethanopterin reductase-like flavin-dependent oxidoreductase (luciferase family)